MDYNAPVAKRTRLKEALFYEELHKKLRKEKNHTGKDIKLEGEGQEQDTDWTNNAGGTDSWIECYESESQEEVVISDELEVIDSVGSVTSKNGDKQDEETEILENFKEPVTIKIEDTDEEDAGVKYNDSMQSSCSTLGIKSDGIHIQAGKAAVGSVSSNLGEADISVSKKSSDELDETQSESSTDTGDSEEVLLCSDDSESSTEEEESCDDDYLINISSSSSVSNSEEEDEEDEEEEEEEDEEDEEEDEEEEDIRMNTNASVENTSKQRRGKSQNDINRGQDQLHEKRCKKSKWASIARRTRSHVNQFFKKKTVKMQTSTSPISINDEQDHLPDKNLHRSKSVDHDCLKNKNPTVANTIKQKAKPQQDFSKGCEIDKPDHHNHRRNRNPSVQKKWEEDFNNEPEKCRRSNKSDDHGGIFNTTTTSGNKIKHRNVKARKDFNILDVLVDSIWDKGDTFLDELTGMRTDLPKSEEPLPLKFTFGIKKPDPPEKTEYERELDELWAELDFALTSFNVGTSSMQEEAKDEIKTDADPTTLCCEGRHNLVLDEQIGVKCKHCSLVVQEIRYILPTFYKYPMGKCGSKDRGTEGAFTIDRVMLEDIHSSKHKHDDSLLFKDSVWDIIPGIHNTMYPHQRAGFEFIWKNIAGGTSLTKIKDKDSTATEGCSGCIISHAPGTGKTRLTIVFLQTYVKLFPNCRPVIIAPCSMLLTWQEELQKWNVDIPFHNLNTREFSGKENTVALHFLLQSNISTRTKNSIRLVKLYSWKKDTSILLLSYRLFEKIAGEDGKSHRNHKKCEAEEKLRRTLLEMPGILVLDEGHTPRNEQSSIWKALSKIETEKRIILSGTPFQNNFGELYNTLCLVRPKFADKFFPWDENLIMRRGRKCKSAKSNWASLTKSIEKDEKLKELQDMLSPFVHVHTGTILKDHLPGLRDCIIVLLPTPLQRTLLQKVEAMPNKNKLELSHLVSVISVHPSLFRDENAPECINMDTLRLQPDAGVKSRFVIELIRLCEALKEKVLVFSQYIDPLTCISDQLKSLFNWTQGNEVLYMDGTLGTKQRQSSINSFNERHSEVRVLLASIRACCEGINLVGASRVVLLDVVWNPSVERQAISRAYRLGQRNFVYIYHLITSGTMEGEKYCRQAQKDRLSELVFSSAASDVEKLKGSSSVCDDRILDEMLRHDKLKCMFEKIIYQPKEANLIETFGLVDS